MTDIDLGPVSISIGEITMRLGLGIGITQPGGGTPTPSNLLTNGTFDTNTTGWTISHSDGASTFSSVGARGRLNVTGPGTYMQVAQAIATTIGLTYRVTGQIVGPIGGAPTFYGIRKSDNATASSNNVEIHINSVASFDQTFVATATTTYIVLQLNDNDTTVDFDNLSVVLA